jgi:hypothetical protein
MHTVTLEGVTGPTHRGLDNPLALARALAQPSLLGCVAADGGSDPIGFSEA